MNLNPLKKDSKNTDALVQALADANAMDDNPPSQQPAAGGVADPATVAADPQLASDTPAAAPAQSDDATTASSDAEANMPSADLSSVDTGAGDDGTATNSDTSVGSENTPQEAPAQKSSADSGISFDDNDLPAGLSSDANSSTPDSSTDTPSPTPEETSPADTSDNSSTPALDITPPDNSDSGELDSVKKSALEQLRPLMEKLELTPDDKFDKYLMMLRASDDPTLIKPAYEAAEGISGDKEKAQAMLDIINEINYITASKQQSS